VKRRHLLAIETREVWVQADRLGREVREVGANLRLAEARRVMMGVANFVKATGAKEA
jgi:hypothetical protein